VLEGLRGESSIAELCRKEGINQNLYYRWSKEFPEEDDERLMTGLGSAKLQQPALELLAIA
jgi:transposase-like protein